MKIGIGFVKEFITPNIEEARRYALWNEKRYSAYTEIISSAKNGKYEYRVRVYRGVIEE